MTEFTTQKVSNFMLDIQSISAENYEIAIKIRNMHFNTVPKISEDIKYGGLVFIKKGELVSGIFFYKQHISLEFSHGVNLLDPYSVLEGKGQFRRHIKMRMLDDITTKNVMSYIQQTLAD